MKSVTKAIALLTISALSVCFSQLTAQTVRKYAASKDSNYGLVYALPKTAVEITVSVELESFTPGSLHLYSRRYLGEDARSESVTTYRIRDIKLRAVGIPDIDNSYIVDFRPGTVAPYIYLDHQGIICSINAGRSPSEASPVLDESSSKSITPSPAISLPPPTLPQEYALASSATKQAEVAAAYLYSIRESLVDLMKGSVETMPKDGAAMKLMLEGLKTQEAATLALFKGSKEIKQSEYKVTFMPEGDVNNRVVFRFSPEFGPMPADDLAGAPVLMNIKVTEDNAPATEEEAKSRERKLKGAIVYNVPGQADVSLTYAGRTIARASLSFAQFGSREVLAPRLFRPKGNNSVQIYFDPSTGAIRQIVGVEE